ncbi:unannotated protein [freshwater metagenome]|uniref:Unannotated protein n=1 Tax=freshwater metagenome TaxID=449393 RepID=A0A6J7JIQ9_9ZZZZ|nr:hypothetical protein [Actinomycetota bacterium]
MKINKKLISAFGAAIFLITNLILAAPANAADKGYRYWGYYQAAPGATSWTAAMTGPTVDIADGSVEGWSFVFSSDDVPSIAPAINPDFSAICGKVKASKDLKRIALVIDFGSRDYAPKGEKVQKSFTTCVKIAKKAQGIDVLGKAVKIRAAKSGLICGINNYPKKECGVEIPTPAALKK